ncbi:MAG: hypothetical protein U0269_23135 [Polyangiales bacterium]
MSHTPVLHRATLHGQARADRTHAALTGALARAIGACVASALLSACSVAPPTHAADAGDAQVADAIDASLGDGRPPPRATVERRISGRAVIAWIRAHPAEPWWIEEELAPIPYREGDREVGPRAIVRANGEGPSAVVFRAEGAERLAWAVAHPSGEWTAAVVDGIGAVSLVRGRADGSVRARVAADDPLFAADPLASFVDAAGPPRAAPIAPGRAQDSVRLAVDGEDALLTLTTYWGSVLAYRWRFVDGAFVRSTRTLLVPAGPLPVFIPDTASYDVFDAITSPWSTYPCVAPDGSAYVAVWIDQNRVRAINAAWSSTLSLLRRDPTLTERPSDILVTRILADGTRSRSLVVGTADVDDEPFAIACSADGRVAIGGRHRREPGRDNTEFHGFVALVDGEGATFAPLSFDGDALTIVQAVAFDRGGAVLFGGSEGWTQNPVGVSVGSPGRPFLARWDGRGAPERSSVVPTRGHSELRAIATSPRSSVALGGIEDGPLSHSYDADRSALRGDGWQVIRPDEVADAQAR